mmetsp:Transcript_11049/g.16441  ORF Transcript_11049/g.16441 Transcript_11049/m.16441 type:complete len:251 (-) Transcript_11049:1514-2266(-)
MMMRPRLSLRSMSHILLRAVKSMPEVGSSSITIEEPPIKAMASDSLRFWPPERFLAGVLRLSSRSTCWIFSSTAAWISALSESPLKRQNIRRCSSTVSSLKSTSCWGHTPNFLRISLMSDLKLRLLTVMSPAVGLSSPVSIEIVVVLPAPLWPSKAKICPSYMSKSKPSTAALFPKCFLSPLTDIAWPVCSWRSKAGSTGSMFSFIALRRLSSSSWIWVWASWSSSCWSEVWPFQKEGVKGKYHGRATPY